VFARLFNEKQPVSVASAGLYLLKAHGEHPVFAALIVYPLLQNHVFSVAPVCELEGSTLQPVEDK
jgi:hypothetical protein